MCALVLLKVNWYSWSGTNVQDECSGRMFRFVAMTVHTHQKDIRQIGRVQECLIQDLPTKRISAGRRPSRDEIRLKRHLSIRLRRQFEHNELSASAIATGNWSASTNHHKVVRMVLYDGMDAFTNRES